MTAWEHLRLPVYLLLIPAVLGVIVWIEWLVERKRK